MGAVTVVRVQELEDLNEDFTAHVLDLRSKGPPHGKDQRPYSNGQKRKKKTSSDSQKKPPRID
jgi:hypothetical protein